MVSGELVRAVHRHDHIVELEIVDRGSVHRDFVRPPVHFLHGNGDCRRAADKLVESVPDRPAAGEAIVLLVRYLAVSVDVGVGGYRSGLKSDGQCHRITEHRGPGRSQVAGALERLPPWVCLSLFQSPSGHRVIPVIAFLR